MIASSKINTVKTNLKKRLSFGQPQQHPTHAPTSSSELYPKSITPLEFDQFVPWMCSQWSIMYDVIVLRLRQEECPKEERRRSSQRKNKHHHPSSHSQEISNGDDNKINHDSKSMRKYRNSLPPSQSYQSQIFVNENNKKNNHDTKSKVTVNEMFYDENSIVIRAYYDTHDRLVEVSFIKSPVVIPMKVIRAISLCLPYHSELTRLTFRRRGLDCSILREVAKLLPLSNITNICLDDSYVPERNYHSLLQYISTLSYLSLKRCGVTDEVCKNIAMCLVYGGSASNSLHALELAMNDITDNGMKELGQMLRTNRSLLHLNLAGNKVTDKGAIALLSSLMEFKLTTIEVYNKRRRRFEELKHVLQQPSTLSPPVSVTNSGESTKTSIQRRKSDKSEFKLNRVEKSEVKLKKSVKSESKLKKSEKSEIALNRKPQDPFSVKNLIIRSDGTYCTGNFTLCSLNLTYNRLQYDTLKMVDEVVSYQNRIVMIPPATGLKAVVLEGNYLINQSKERVSFENEVQIKDINPLKIARQRLARLPSSCSSLIEATAESTKTSLRSFERSSKYVLPYTASINAAIFKAAGHIAPPTSFISNVVL